MRQSNVTEAALGQRLSEVGAVLCETQISGGTSRIDELVMLTDAVRAARDHSAAWLLVVALTGAFPQATLVRSVRRALALKTSDDAAVWLLDAVAPLAMEFGSADARLRLLSDKPVVDVDFTAKTDFLTGIQRVVRGVVSQWSAHNAIELVVWNSRGGAYRVLNDLERARMLGQDVVAEVDHIGVTPEIVVPWGVPVVVSEVPTTGSSDRLAAVAEFGVASLRLVGHDCIPVSSAETVPPAEPEKFGRFLELVKFSDRLAGVSQSAASEFSGFVRAVSAQGLTGPVVSACPLPHTVRLAKPPESVSHVSHPLVVSLGTVGRRKNQVALVEAAEMLWREGLEFELQMFGHVGSEHTALKGLIPELQRQGRPLKQVAGASDSSIAAALDQARCLVFPSLHEGYGLPIVEALSHGVPVITSDFGSMREAAADSGSLIVDPEDNHALTDALRTVLTDDEVHAGLVEKARSRPVRTWSDYATELWEELLT